MAKKYSRYKLLDEILEFLKSSTEDEPIDLIEISNTFPNLSFRDRKIILDKLKSDDVIGEIKNDKVVYKFVYYITYEGLLLLDDGGYVGRKEERRC